MRVFSIKIIFCILFVFFAANVSFAQKKEDDNKPCTRAQLAQLIVDTLPWVKELPDNVKNAVGNYELDKTFVRFELAAILYGINRWDRKKIKD